MNVRVPAGRVLPDKVLVDRIGKRLGVKEPEDWYSKCLGDIENKNHVSTLKRYGSLSHMLKSVYCDYDWKLWRFKEVPKGIWKVPSERKDFLDWLGPQLGVFQLEDWYNVRQEDFLRLGGSGILAHFGNSFSRMVTSTYEEKVWDFWRFRHAPKGSWEDPAALKKFVGWLYNALELRSLDDWYRVSLEQIATLAPVFCFRKHGGLAQVLMKVYPDHSWDVTRISHPKMMKSSQWRLKRTVEKLFPGVAVYENYHDQDMKFTSGLPMELDVFVPDLRLALEYQGLQHYQDIFSFGPKEDIHERDEQKRALCEERDITLVDVPYWWDFGVESLAGTIKSRRPELPIQGGSVIPSRPAAPAPKNSNDMTVKSHLVSNRFKTFVGRELGWWMSEKYDGIRAYWDGKEFFSKQGKSLHVPGWFIEGLPAIPLDGELWAGKLNLERMISLINSNTDAAGLWKDITYCVFDLPASNQSYEIRIQELSKIALPNHAKPVEIIECKNPAHLEEYLESVLLKDGEGVMVQQPGAFYTPGRTTSMLKVKRIFDTEVRMVKVDGTHSLLCVQSNGQTCLVRCPSEVLQNPPASGATITVKYTGFWSNGNIKNPFFWRVRADMMLSPKDDRVLWDEAATELGVRKMDDWYSVKLGDVDTRLLKHYGGSFMQALSSVYPEHEWQPWKFQLPHGFWRDKSNQVACADWIGKCLGVEKMEDWYNHTGNEFTERGGGKLFRLFDENFSRMITTIYSHHDWRIWAFEPMPKGIWEDGVNQITYLDWAAKRLEIRDLNGWYDIIPSVFSQLESEQIVDPEMRLLKMYSNSLSKMLASVYPDHEWLPWRFYSLPKGAFDDKSNQREYMDWLGKKLRTKSLDDWYRISLLDIQRVASPTLFINKGLGNILCQVYPEHSWDISRLERKRPTKSSQRFLAIQVRDIFPNIDVFEDHLMQGLEFQSGYTMQLDIFVPSLLLAFEYQGQQHYHETYPWVPQATYAKRDQEKREACESLGITLIEIPYWWDFKKDSLLATIHSKRADLIGDFGGAPISPDPPS